MYMHRCMYFMKILTHYSFTPKKSNISLNVPILLSSALYVYIIMYFLWIISLKGPRHTLCHNTVYPIPSLTLPCVMVTLEGAREGGQGEGGGEGGF